MSPAARFGNSACCMIKKTCYERMEQRLHNPTSQTYNNLNDKYQALLKLSCLQASPVKCASLMAGRCCLHHPPGLDRGHWGSVILSADPPGRPALLASARRPCWPSACCSDRASQGSPSARWHHQHSWEKPALGDSRCHRRCTLCALENKGRGSLTV